MFLVACHRDTHDSTEYLWPKEAKPWETVCAHPCDGVKTGSVLTGAEMTSVGLRLAFLLHLRWEGDICSRWLCVYVHDFFVQFTDNLTGGEERCKGPCWGEAWETSGSAYGDLLPSEQNLCQAFLGTFWQQGSGHSNPRHVTDPLSLCPELCHPLPTPRFAVLMQGRESDLRARLILPVWWKCVCLLFPGLKGPDVNSYFGFRL